MVPAKNSAYGFAIIFSSCKAVIMICHGRRQVLDLGNSTSYHDTVLYYVLGYFDCISVSKLEVTI